jgi:hypothetical protein
VKRLRQQAIDRLFDLARRNSDVGQLRERHAAQLAKRSATVPVPPQGGEQIVKQRHGPSPPP